MRALILTVSLASAQASGAAVSFDEAMQLADENESSLNGQQFASLLEAQGDALGSAIGACGRPGMDLSRFTIVFRLNTDGSVAKSWLKGDTLLAQCVHDHLAMSGFPGLWSEPFYTSLNMSFGP